MLKKKNQFGFTMMELLVVIAIIGLVVTVGMVSYASVNQRSRDAKRKSDMEQIRAALEMYRAENQNYPDQDTWKTDLQNGYIPRVPSDPQGIDYVYEEKDASNLSYCISSTLENTDTALAESQCSNATGNYGLENP